MMSMRNSASPLVGSPGRAWAPVAAPPPVGDGELSARVDMAVRMTTAGIPSASTIALVDRIDEKIISSRPRSRPGGIRGEAAGLKYCGFLLAGLTLRLLLRLETLA